MIGTGPYDEIIAPHPTLVLASHPEIPPSTFTMQVEALAQHSSYVRLLLLPDCSRYDDLQQIGQEIELTPQPCFSSINRQKALLQYGVLFPARCKCYPSSPRHSMHTS